MNEILELPSPPTHIKLRTLPALSDITTGKKNGRKAKMSLSHYVCILKQKYQFTTKLRAFIILKLKHELRKESERKLGQ